ncbi:MAG: DsbA family protein [Patescibacteria group bacterium]|nr:DsbA family protein [Patescibacteria group bacterium]
MPNTDQKPIISAIIIAGVLIAGAILLKGSKPSATANIPIKDAGTTVTALAPVGASDRVIGNPQAKVTLVMYEDFQCPFCGKFFKESEETIRSTYVQTGSVQFVYRDFAFLGPESDRAAQAARCAGDQGKFWEYHDYLFTHQSGENQGAFADPSLKSFAKNLGLNSATFNGCLDAGKYVQVINDAKNEGGTAGVTGTPKGFILVGGKVVDTIDGAEPFTTVKTKLDSALK